MVRAGSGCFTWSNLRGRRRPRCGGSVDAEVAAELGDGAGGLDVVHRLLERAVRSHDERGTQHAGDVLAVELLVAVGAVRHQDLTVLVRLQREVEAVALPEGAQ